MSETVLMRRILAAAQRHFRSLRLFRNHVGTGYAPDGTPITYGLPPGSPDLIGWLPVTITADMVGRTVAVFVGIEVKTPAGRISPKQRTWQQLLERAGAIVGVARSEDDAVRILGSQPGAGDVGRDGERPGGARAARKARG